MLDGVCGQHHALPVLPPERSPSTHCRGWVSLRASLAGYVKSCPPTGFRTSDRPAHRELRQHCTILAPFYCTLCSMLPVLKMSGKCVLHFRCKLQSKEHGNELHLMSKECICTYNMGVDENTWVNVKEICICRHCTMLGSGEL